MSKKTKPKTPPALPEPIVSTERLCELFNLTSARIGQLAKNGIIFKTERNQYDLWRSVRGYIEFLQKSKTEGASHIERSGVTGDTQELEELVQQVKAARTYNDARTLKVQIDALRSGYALEVDQNKYCSVAEVDEAMLRIGAAVKAAIMRMEADLPQALEGMTPAAMQKVIRGKVDEVLTMLSQEGERVWE